MPPESRLEVSGGAEMSDLRSFMMVMAAGLIVASAQKPPSAQQVVQSLLTRARTTQSYAYQWEYQERDASTGKLGAKEIYKLEFLKPHYRELTIIQRDFFSNGAVLTYNPDKDKKVHARKGIIHRTYEPNDSEIANFFKTDLDYIARDIQRLFKGSRAEPVGQGQMDGRAVWIVTFYPANDEIKKVVLWIDAQDAMPRRIEHHDAQGLRSLRVYTDYSFPKLKTDDFAI
jgi:outer membrane lipoprotein-sorting protein